MGVGQLPVLNRANYRAQSQRPSDRHSSPSRKFGLAAMHDARAWRESDRAARFVGRLHADGGTAGSLTPATSARACSYPTKVYRPRTAHRTRPRVQPDDCLPPGLYRTRYRPPQALEDPRHGLSPPDLELPGHTRRCHQAGDLPKPRVLHQAREKPLVTRSQHCRNSFSGLGLTAV